jgi:hypothetical protein
MRNPEGVREQSIGPFEYGEAVDHIRQYALALTNLKLNNRFTVLPTPRPVVEIEKRWDNKQGRRQRYYQVILVDRKPGEPLPEGLTALQIKAAEAQGYEKKRKVIHYDAFGQSMTLPQWAKVAGVSRPTLKSRLDAGMTMEEAITQIALKRAA